MTTIETDIQLHATIEKALRETPITDIHTHLYAPAFGSLLLWGIDELLTYHYLVAEVFRYIDMPYERFWTMSKQQQADLIWQTLFIEHSPISEACRGVLTVLQQTGLDTSTRDLLAYRRYFAQFSTEQYTTKVFEMANIRTVVMTNDPFDDMERTVWETGYQAHPQFKTALRIDTLLNTWSAVVPRLQAWGYTVENSLTETTLKEIRRFLIEWITRLDPLYLAVSLPPNFCMPEESARACLLTNAVLPVCCEFNKPFAAMIGVKKLVNPHLRLAGDSVGKGDIDTVEYLCATYPNNKFLVTMLARENQHELCVASRKFRNLLPFGCWWFLNNPSLIEEMSRLRFELLGLSVIPQHSDARVLDQLIYKWEHTRAILAKVLHDKYRDMTATGWVVSEEEIQRDVADILGGVFWKFLSA